MSDAGCSLRGLLDDEVEASLRALLCSGARLEARIVAHLAEVERRGIHLRVRRSSMYEYCQKDLGLSEYEAFCRIAAARLASAYPIIFGMLERRELHLTALVEVRPFLTEANHQELLRAVSRKTKREIREILALRFPQADVATRIRRLAAENRAGRALEPLAAERYRLELTISKDLKQQLELAQDLLSHANSGGDLALVLERALSLLIEKLRARRFGASRRKCEREAKPTGAKVSPAPAAARDSVVSASLGTAARAAIPAHVRRQVVERDGERCAYLDERGRRCESRAFLQLHHREPWARGGQGTVANLQLLCRQHNRLLAERDFGQVAIERAIAHRRAG